VTGLVAALFDREHFEKAVSGEEELFEEKMAGNWGSAKKIALTKTKEGAFGSHYMGLQGKRRIIGLFRDREYRCI
jgi:hypothetical protein